MKLLVHRKGSTRAFPPHHPLIPADYQLIGQPVLVGGTMGTSSYVLTGGCGLRRVVVVVGQPVLVGGTMGTSSYVLTGGCGLTVVGVG